MSQKRCFVAVQLPEAVRSALGDAQQRLRRQGLQARWVRPKAMHLTLKFLGELPPALFDDVAGAFASPLPGPDRLHLQVQGLGTFPPGKRARVLWAGVRGDVPELAALARAVDDRLAPLGVAREQRLFRPHLTLGRARGRSKLDQVTEILQQLGPFSGPTFEACEAALMESRLQPDGPRYRQHLSIPLAAPPLGSDDPTIPSANGDLHVRRP